jgi:hypothetical protein
MVNRTDAGTLFAMAHDAAQDVFDTDTTAGNADKVCAVALNILADSSVAFFSGAPGYARLVERLGGNRRDAQATVTGALTNFLQSAAGGGFTPDQIRNRAYAEHGRGAVNCAEPKVWYYISAVLRSDPGNWVIIPFNKVGDGLVYNPPCRNCRRWVYGQFHGLSRTIALGYGGADALNP